MSGPVLEASNLVRHFRVGGGAPVRAVDGVSLTLERQETLALVGESGSGKTTLGRMLVGLDRPTAGLVRLEGQDIHGPKRDRLQVRRRLQVVFQDPYGALDPRLTVGESIAEGLIIHRLGSPAERPEQVARLLTEVGLDPDAAGRYPHEFSGGQRQRIGIARALAVEPSVLICDEPVSSLDVSVQAQILNLLRHLQRDRGLALLFIAHDLAVVHQLAHRVAVMYLGRVVELGPAAEVLSQPRHPYTRALLSAVPRIEPGRPASRVVLKGEPPSPRYPPTGCAFHPRCYHPLRDARCGRDRPALEPHGAHLAACHYADTPPTA